MRDKQPDRTQLLRRMAELAECRVNDAVKLAFLEGEWPEQIDEMDLTALTEFKRSGNGAVEMKFMNRMAALEQLIELTDEDDFQRAEAFFRALDQKTESGDGGGI